MSKKTVANQKQLIALRQEMMLYPDMGETNPYLDPRWAQLKVKLDPLGKPKDLEQWKKTWKNQEKNLPASTNMNANVTPVAALNQTLVPMMQRPLTQVGPPYTSVGAVFYNSAGGIVPATATTHSMQAVYQPQPIMKNENPKSYAVPSTAIQLPQFVFPHQKIDDVKEDIEDIEDDPDVQYVGHAINAAEPQQTRQNLVLNKENQQPNAFVGNQQPNAFAENQLRPNAYVQTNDGKRRALTRSSQASNTAVALEAMNEHNSVMLQLKGSTDNLSSKIEKTNNDDGLYRAQVLSSLTNIYDLLTKFLEKLSDKTPDK